MTISMDVKIFPPDEPVETAVTLPLSKSESNRLLIINAVSGLAAGDVAVSDCDDTRVIVRALEKSAGAVNVGPAGTAMRFLTAYFAAKQGCEVTLDGDERMRQRPIGPLVAALRECGAQIDYVGEEGFPPLRISGRRLHGGNVRIDATVSSQFISALMMVGPAMEGDLILELDGELASRPYVEMTAAMMRRAGADVSVEEDEIRISATPYSRPLTAAEGDWSAASYWYEIAAVSSGFVTLRDLAENSIQGDRRIAELMEVTGLRTERLSANEVELTPTPDPGSRLIADFSATPDLAQTMAVTCCLLSIPFRFTGLHSLKIKETDRLTALQTELGKLGFIVEKPDDGTLVWAGVYIQSGEKIEPIETYGDHRMAMAFAPAALFYPNLVIKSAQCVAKSYPGFWDDMRRAGFTIEEL